MKVKLTWEEVLKILKEKLAEKYPMVDVETLEFYKDYCDEAEGAHYDFPTGIYLSEHLNK